MAENKKSFVVYSDWKNVFDELPDADAGKLIKHIFAYVNDENPKSDSVLINAVFANIKTTLKRDLNRWENQIQQRKKAGKASVESRKNKMNEFKQSLTVVNETERSLTKPNETERNSTVSVNVNDNVNVNVKERESIEERKLKFSHSLKMFENIYSVEMLKLFYDYWTEPNKSNTKFRQEMEKTWDTALRLKKWQQNNTKYNKHNGKQSTIDAALHF